jgi:hypothetical protein
MLSGVSTQSNQRLFSLIIMAVFLFFSAPSFARFGSGLDEETFTDLKKRWETNPNAIMENVRVLRRLSAQQISDLMEYKDTSHYSFLHVVVVKGEELQKEVLGNKNSSLSVMVNHNNRMQPIPFQIDEVDITGLTFIPDVKKYDIDGEEGIFDKQDEVAFMYRDASFEPYEKGKTLLPRGEVLKEVVLSFQDRKPRYAYIVKGNNRRSDANYVNMNIDQGNFNSTYFTMSWDPKNFSQMRNIIPKVGPEQGKNVVDNIYFEVSTGIFNKNVRFGLNSKKHIFANILGVKQGPIRVNALVKGRVKYAGIPSMPYYLNMIFTEQSISFRSRSTPDGYKYAKYVTKILKDPGIYVSIDFHNIDGAKIKFHSISDSPEIPTVDGKMSKIEHRINEERLPGDWFWIESGHGWSIFFSNNWPIIEKGLFDAFLEGMSFHMIYEDDISKTTKYERFPGGEPRVGVEGRGLPKIALEMMSAISKVPWGEVQSMEDMGNFLIKGSENGDLKNLNKIITRVIISEREKGKINNSKELANAFIADFDLVGLRGVDRPKLNQAFRTAIEKLERFEDFNIGQIVKDMQAASKEIGIDGSLIHYAPRDNVLWFPDSMGEAGPDGFRQEVQNPPRYQINSI